MNEIAEIIEPKAEAGFDLVVIADPDALAVLDPLKVFAPGNALKVVERLEDLVRAIPTDASTESGRKAIKAIDLKVRKSAIVLGDMADALTEDWKRKTKEINAVKKEVDQRVRTLAAEILRPVTEFEEAEAARAKAHEEALAMIESLADVPADSSSGAITLGMACLEELARRAWEGFQPQANYALAKARPKMLAAHAAAHQREADAAELAELREMKAQRDAARIADEQERQAAEASAALIEAANVVAAGQAKAAIDAAASQQAEAERAAQAATARAEQAERDRLAAIEQAEKDRVAAVAAAEVEKQAAVQAEKDRAEAARLAEAAEAERRAANRAHAAKIMGAAKASLVEHAGLSEPAAKATVKAIFDGLIPHTAISF